MHNDEAALSEIYKVLPRLSFKGLLTLAYVVADHMVNVHNYAALQREIKSENAKK